MAPADEENKSNKHYNANPFVAFRRFADDQMSTLINGVFSISSLFASPAITSRHSVQDHEKSLLEAQESSQRLAYEAEEAERIMDVYTKAHKEDQLAIQEGIQEPTNTKNCGSQRCPYRPAEQESAQLEDTGLNICFPDDKIRFPLSLAAFSIHHPSAVLTSPMLGEQLPSVPIEYLLYSPYSPVRLENQPRLCDHGAKWREAFQDLLTVQSGQGLPPKGPQRLSESGLDRVSGMMDLATCERGQASEESSDAPGNTSDSEQDLGLLSLLIGARLPEDHANDNENADNNGCESGDAEITELDLYDKIFASQHPSSNNIVRAASRFLSHPPEGSSSEKENRIPRILSTLTTTERITLRDGSLHTKVVLKKRFSDGCEESTETVHHQNAVHQTQDPALKLFKDEVDRNPGQNKDTEENRSSGWFWS
ncbi:hypothetical protein BDR22DRAFT_62697 [Usnea florida]